MALPTASDSGKPVGAPSTADAEQAVRDAYANFVMMLSRADTLPEQSRRSELSTVMAEPQLSHVVKHIDDLKRRHLATYGTVTVHVKSIQIKENDATIYDCRDSRGAGLVDSITHKKINRGIKEDNTKVLLTKGPDQRWRVSESFTLSKGC
ncbi:hypothetical protein ACQPZP_05535 [Spirillospora sp. CA-142024]|uniref:hypothetical protein n=1 Tax=Spirillospora sp. CA-142024 TaxID=3240036 RepID=UPI003D8F261D